MKTKHTQGEWKWFRFMTSLNGQPFKDLNIAITHPDHDNICSLTVNLSKQDEAEANAKLIAAAPELLEALIELTDCDYTSGTHLSCAIAKAKKAIKKATE